MSVERRIHQHWSVREVVYRLVDAVCILGGLMAAVYITRLPSGEHHIIGGLVAILLGTIVAEVSGAYRSWRGVSIEAEMITILVAWALTIPMLLTLGMLTGELDRYSSGLLCTWFAATASLMALTRMLIRFLQATLHARGFQTRGYAIVGINDSGLQLARSIEKSPEVGLRLVGFFDDRPLGRTSPLPPEMGRHTGNTDDLLRMARSREVDVIYITFPMRAEDRIRKILNKLSDTTASVYLVPDFFVFELLHSRWTNISGMPVVSVFENPFYGIDGMVKRGMDLVLGSMILAAAAIPMALIAAGIKLTSRGPVFFRQKRYGLDGREIWVWKFRTMRVCEAAANFTQAHRNDPRVTWFGAILRSTSLDELPQLFNVIQGNMSLVGPRPHASLQNEEYRRQIRGYMLRHKVRPGITGLAQINGWRGETDTLLKMEQRIACDHQYIREWSLWLDLKILFKTIFTVLSRENAY